MRDTLVIANWKMNGSRAENARWVETFNAKAPSLSSRCVVCAPFVYLSDLVNTLSIDVGAENVADEVQGAYTGEVSAAMLADIGVKWTIVGHSERRTLYGETDEGVAKKCARLVSANVRPILCVGETLEEREAGKTADVVLRQLDAVLKVVSPKDLGAIAYEPVWAIGTGLTATPEEAQAVHAQLRARVAEVDDVAAQTLSILYGGSVKPANAATLFAMPDIDGGLIGGAALNPNDFLSIAQACPAR